MLEIPVENPHPGGIETSRRNVPFYVQTLRKSLLIFVVPKRRKWPMLDQKKCTVSLWERQFATLYLFHAYTPWPPKLFMYGASLPFKIRENPIHKEFRGGVLGSLKFFMHEFFMDYLRPPPSKVSQQYMGSMQWSPQMKPLGVGAWRWHERVVSCCLIGVPKTVLLVNCAFVPPEKKKGVFDENGENDESAF